MTGAQLPHPIAVPTVVVGGVGGSGTRVVSDILRGAGVFMGSDLNSAGDNLSFTMLFKHPPLLARRKEVSRRLDLFAQSMAGPACEHDPSPIAEARYETEQWQLDRWDRFCQNYREDQCHVAKWGWKEPNSHYFLADILNKWRSIRYVHVIRHGLDMAFSSNQRQVALWGCELLTEDGPLTPRRSLEFWLEANERATSEFNERCILLRFEDLCNDPHSTIAKLAHDLSLSIEPDHMNRLVKSCSAPGSVDRHITRNLDFLTDHHLSRMSRLGYQPNIAVATTGTRQGEVALSSAGEHQAPRMPELPDPAWILGMHRSGTSALTGAISRLGLDIGSPEEMISPDQWNPDGYNELSKLVAINDELLGSLDSNWFDCYYFLPARVPEAALESARSRLDALLTELSGLDKCSRIALKDPRLCLTLEALAPGATSIVFLYRDPLEVARSLHRRDHFEIPFGLALWELYNVRACRLVSAIGAHWVNYQELVANPSRVLNGIAEYLSGNSTKPIDMADLELAASGISTRQHAVESCCEAFVLPWHKALWKSLISNDAHSAARQGVSPHSVAILNLMRRVRKARSDALASSRA